MNLGQGRWTEWSDPGPLGRMFSSSQAFSVATWPLRLPIVGKTRQIPNLASKIQKKCTLEPPPMFLSINSCICVRCFSTAERSRSSRVFSSALLGKSTIEGIFSSVRCLPALLKGIIVTLVSNHGFVVKVQNVGAHFVQEITSVRNNNKNFFPLLKIILQPHNWVASSWANNIMLSNLHEGQDDLSAHPVRARQVRWTALWPVTRACANLRWIHSSAFSSSVGMGIKWIEQQKLTSGVKLSPARISAARVSDVSASIYYQPKKNGDRQL